MPTHRASRSAVRSSSPSRPTGVGIVFTARDVGREEAWSTDLDLFEVPIDGSSPPRKLTSENRATDTDPSFSPDGTMLAYLAMDRPGYEADKLTVIVRSWPGGDIRRLTDDWDRSVERLEWSPDGRTLYVLAEDTGQRGLFALDVATGSVTPLVAQGHVSQAKAVSDAIFYSHDSLAGPADVHVLRDGRHRRLTRLNASKLRGVGLGAFEQFSFDGWNGETVHGFVLKPAGFDPARTYPVAFIVHGGPQGSMGNDLHYRWNPQVYAGPATLSCSRLPRLDRLRPGVHRFDPRRLGRQAARGSEAGSRRRPRSISVPRSSATASLGASYGGLHDQPDRRRLDRAMALSGHARRQPGRAVSPTSRPRSCGSPSGSTAAPRGRTRPATPSTTRSTTSKTGASDARHPRGARLPGRRHDGFATFTALQRRGVPSRLLHFPDENHWVLKPQNSVLWHDTVLEWLDRWTT